MEQLEFDIAKSHINERITELHNTAARLGLQIPTIIVTPEDAHALLEYRYSMNLGMRDTASRKNRLVDTNMSINGSEIMFDRAAYSFE